MPRIYLETSFISACVSDRQDAASVFRRETSNDWWASQRQQHDVFISAEVIRELSHPTYRHRTAALDLLEEVELLPITEEVIGLAELLVREKAMPSPIAGDAIHVAASTVHDAQYLLSWNVRHLANPNKLTHLRTICLRFGLLPPIIVTPDHVWEADA